MSNVEKAVECFSKGFNCAQAIISTYGGDYGLKEADGLRVAAAFGAGIARSGDVCGALSGALMVIGLKHAKGVESKEKVIAAAQDFMKAFAGRCGSVNCKELLGIDLSTPEGQKKFKEGRLSRSRCCEFVRASAELLEKTA